MKGGDSMAEKDKEQDVPEQTDNGARPEDGDQSEVSQSADVAYESEVDD